MSVYNLENQTALKYYKKHKEYILDTSNKEYINKYFLVGEKINKKEQQFSLIMIELLCTENCEIINYIDDKLNGRLELKKPKLLKVLKEEDQDIIYNITQVIREEMNWEDTPQW